MRWVLWPLKTAKRGAVRSWHLYDYTSRGSFLVMICGKALAPDRAPADLSDAPLPDGKTCEACFRVKASRDARAA